MSYANAPEPRGFDSHDQAYLSALPELNCDAPPKARVSPQGLLKALSKLTWMRISAYTKTTASKRRAFQFLRGGPRRTLCSKA